MKYKQKYTKTGTYFSVNYKIKCNLFIAYNVLNVNDGIRPFSINTPESNPTKTVTTGHLNFL